MKIITLVVLISAAHIATALNTGCRIVMDNGIYTVSTEDEVFSSSVVDNGATVVLKCKDAEKDFILSNSSVIIGGEVTARCIGNNSFLIQDNRYSVDDMKCNAGARRTYDLVSIEEKGEREDECETNLLKERKKCEISGVFKKLFHYSHRFLYVCFDEEKAIAKYAYHFLKKETRKKRDFHVGDCGYYPAISPFQSYKNSAKTINDRYPNSGLVSVDTSTLEKGHLAPRADFCKQKDENCDCIGSKFYEVDNYMNVVPMWSKINRGVWKTLEKLIREKLSQLECVHIWTGIEDIFKTTPNNDELYIGLNSHGGRVDKKLPVPRILYKIVRVGNEYYRFNAMNTIEKYVKDIQDPSESDTVGNSVLATICRLWVNIYTEKNNWERKIIQCGKYIPPVAPNK